MSYLQSPLEAMQNISLEQYPWEFDERKACTAAPEENEAWFERNKMLSMVYRYSHDYLMVIYRLADTFLESMLGKDYTLPVDVRKLAAACNFSIEMTNFERLKKERKDRTFAPVAQLEMRSTIQKNAEDRVVGTISVEEDLGENDIRFSIAHELSCYVLRRYNPIGLSYLHEACPGMYALSDSDELLSDSFAYAILLPYEKFRELRKAYEADNSRWPINYSDWIGYLRDRAQIPEYRAVLAYQNLKQYAIALRLQEAMNNTEPWLKNIIRWLTEKNISKTEMKEVLTYSGDTVEQNRMQERLAETIDFVQDEMYEDERLKKRGTPDCNPQEERECSKEEVENINAVPQEDGASGGDPVEEQKTESAPQQPNATESKQNEQTEKEDSFIEWKKSIIINLFELGMMDPDLKVACEELKLEQSFSEILIEGLVDKFYKEG